VAQIVSPSRSAEDRRDALKEASQIAGVLEIKPGMTVADIGAGSGYHTVRLSPLVGSVVAEDVTRDYLVELARRTEQLKLTNVTFALGEPHDPRLPAASLDAALLVHMYHEIAQPYAFLYNLAPAFKPDARIGIVDLERPTAEHGTPVALLRCELAAVGYREIGTYQLAGDGGYPGGVFTALASGSEISRGDRCLRRWCRPRQALINVPATIAFAEFHRVARAQDG
jgi:SAM-dependent methyltransferase